MTKSIDLAALSTATACDKGFEMELLHPVTRVGLGVFISVVGKDSVIFKGHVRAKANERLRKTAEAGRRGREGDPITVEGAEKDTIDLLAACTTAWRNVTFEGAALEFSADNARRLYGESWIREQVDEAVGDLGNFMKG